MKKIKKFIYKLLYKLLYKYYKYKYNNTLNNDKLKIMYLATASYFNKLSLDFTPGMCGTIKSTCERYNNINYTTYTISSFKQFSYNIAKEKFNAIDIPDIEAKWSFWWEFNNVKDRYAYFRYLIKFYKYDN